MRIDLLQTQIFYDISIVVTFTYQTFYIFHDLKGLQKPLSKLYTLN